MTFTAIELEHVCGGRGPARCPPARQRFGISCSDWLDLQEDRNDAVPGRRGGRRAPR